MNIKREVVAKVGDVVVNTMGTMAVVTGEGLLTDDLRFAKPHESKGMERAVRKVKYHNNYKLNKGI